jgi:crotonobetainyl-CoA:carnitine CoA-transferase CaiB-like acyl-CoA transferase
LLGVRVVDLVSGPMRALSRHLIDLGAHVTRVHLTGITDDTGFGPVVDRTRPAPRAPRRGTNWSRRPTS